MNRSVCFTGCSSKIRDVWSHEKELWDGPPKEREKTSSIRGGTRFWGPIELAEGTLNPPGRMAISFFAILQKKDQRNRALLISHFWLLEASPGFYLPNIRYFTPADFIS